MEKTLKKIAVILCFIICATSTVFSQNLSTYEQKRYELAEQTLKAMADEDATIALAWAHARSKKIEEDGPFEDFMLDVYFTEELIKAIGLGTSFMSTDDWVEYAQMQTFKQIYQTWVTKREALDKTRTAADIEHERKLTEAPPEPRKGTVDFMIHLLKKDFDKWGKKGTYEKTPDYENRLNTLGIQHFDSVCIELVNDMWKISEYADIVDEGNKGYDADREVVSFTLIYGDAVSGKHQIHGEGPLPIDVAKEFSDLEFHITEAQVSNRLILPKKMIAYVYYNSGHSKQKCELVFQDIPNAKPLNVCFNDIRFIYSGNIDKLRSHCFNLEDFFAKQKEENKFQYNNLQEVKLKFENIEKQYKAAADKYSYSKGSNNDLSNHYKPYKEEFPYFDNWFRSYVNDSLKIIFPIFEYGNPVWDITWSCNDIRKLLNVSFEDFETDASIYGIASSRLSWAIDKATNSLNLRIRKCQNNEISNYYHIIDAVTWYYLRDKSDFLSVNNSTLNMFDEKDRTFYGKIKNVSFEGNVVVFSLSKNEEFRGEFFTNRLKSPSGDYYHGEKTEDILSTDDGSMVLYRPKFSRFGYYSKEVLLLIVNGKKYFLSDKAQKALHEHGMFNERRF